MEHAALDAVDWELVDAARAVIRRAYRAGRHSVGAAVRCPSGRVYTGVNVSGSSACAEVIALGAAISAGERAFACVVAVEGWTEERALLAPCGRCRQVFADYAPDIGVILAVDSQPVKVRAAELLPVPYQTFDDETA